MPFVLLLVLMVACLWEDWPQFLDQLGLPPSPALASALTWSGVFLLIAAAAALTHRTCTRLRTQPAQAGLILRRYRRGRLLLFVAQMIFGGLALFVLGWGWAVQSLGPRGPDGNPVLYPGAEALLFLPWLVTIVLSWFWFYDVEQLV